MPTISGREKEDGIRIFSVTALACCLGLINLVCISNMIMTQEEEKSMVMLPAMKSHPKWNAYGNSGMIPRNNKRVFGRTLRRLRSREPQDIFRSKGSMRMRQKRSVTFAESEGGVRFPRHLDPAFDEDQTTQGNRLVFQDDHLSIFYKPNGVSVQGEFEKEGIPPAYALAKSYGGLVIFPDTVASSKCLKRARPNMTFEWHAVVDGSPPKNWDLKAVSLDDNACEQPSFTVLEAKVVSQASSWGRGALSTVLISTHVPGHPLSQARVTDTYAMVNVVAKELIRSLSVGGHPVVSGGGSRRDSLRALRGGAARGMYLALTGIELHGYLSAMMKCESALAGRGAAPVQEWVEGAAATTTGHGEDDDILRVQVRTPAKFGRMLLREARFALKQRRRNAKEGRMLQDLFSSLKLQDLSKTYAEEPGDHMGNHSEYTRKMHALGLQRLGSVEARGILDALGIRQPETCFAIDSIDSLLELYTGYVARNPRQSRRRILQAPHTANIVAAHVSAFLETPIVGRPLQLRTSFFGGNIQEKQSLFTKGVGEKIAIEPVALGQDRSQHSEVVSMNWVLERIRKELCNSSSDSSCEQELRNVTGCVDVFITHIPCVSCMGAFVQMMVLLPNVEIRVGWEDWRDFQKRIPPPPPPPPPTPSAAGLRQDAMIPAMIPAQLANEL